MDASVQQFIGEFFASYRVVEEPRGWLDLLAGFRYTYLGNQVGLQANNMAIDAASTQLVDQFAQQLATPGSDLRTLVARNITDKLGALDGNNPNQIYLKFSHISHFRWVAWLGGFSLRSTALRLIKVESDINGILPAGGGPLPFISFLS